MSDIITRSTDAATLTPFLVLGPFMAEDEAQSIVHDILGRTYPDVTLRPALSASGILQLGFTSEADAEAARLFHRLPASFTIASENPALPARYVPQGSIRRAQQDIQHLWILEVGFRELAP